MTLGTGNTRHPRAAVARAPRQALRLRGAPILAACLLALAAPHALAVNKCIDKTGSVKYQADPCPDTATQQVITGQKPISGGGEATPLATNGPSGASAPAAASAKKLAADDTSEDGPMLELVSTQTTFEGCSEASPGFAQRNAGVYNAWRAKNAVAMARYENTPRYKLLLENGRTQMRGQPLERMAGFCDSQVVERMKGLAGVK